MDVEDRTDRDHTDESGQWTSPAQHWSQWKL